MDLEMAGTANISYANREWQAQDSLYDWYNHTYPTCGYCNCNLDDKGQKALKLISTLMDKKLIKVEKVKDFVKLMNEIVELL